MSTVVESPPRNVDPLAHQGLVRSIALRYRGRGLEPEDLISAGQLGLLRACELFDESRGKAFSTYATHWIRQAIRRAIMNEGAMIRVPAYLHRIEPAGGSPECVEAAARARDANILRDGDVEGGVVGGTIADHRPDPLGRLEAAELAEALRCLPPRQRDAIRLRFGLDGETCTLEAIGRRFGVSREAIRQLEAKALATLRLWLADPAGLTPHERHRRARLARRAATTPEPQEEPQEEPMSLRVPIPDAPSNGHPPKAEVTADHAPAGSCPECGVAFGKRRRCFNRQCSRSGYRKPDPQTPTPAIPPSVAPAQAGMTAPPPGRTELVPVAPAFDRLTRETEALRRCGELLATLDPDSRAWVVATLTRHFSR